MNELSLQDSRLKAMQQQHLHSQMSAQSQFFPELYFHLRPNGSNTSPHAAAWSTNQMTAVGMPLESHGHGGGKNYGSNMRPHSQTTDSSTSAADYSDNSSDPAGHDLGFLDLSPDSTNTEETSQSQPHNGNPQDGVQVPSAWGTEHCAQPFDIGEDASEERKDAKRRRGRPVGSKDRQPRVKRMFQGAPDEKEDGKEGGRRKPWKIILTADQAVEIYRRRPIGASEAARSSCRSSEVAERYGVNSKTIRDIWNRTTWVKATRECWTVEEEQEYLDAQARQGDGGPSGRGKKGEGGEGWGGEEEHVGKRARGRPKGAVDTRPRVKRRTKSPEGGDGAQEEGANSSGASSDSGSRQGDFSRALPLGSAPHLPPTHPAMMTSASPPLQKDGKNPNDSSTNKNSTHPIPRPPRPSRSSSLWMNHPAPPAHSDPSLAPPLPPFLDTSVLHLLSASDRHRMAQAAMGFR